jgi:uncharacterized alpha-E superfamily protein
VLLSRVGGNLYWAARYLERAATSARIVREHTNLLVDLPTDEPLTWEPLLSISSSIEAFQERHPAADEANVIDWVIADEESPSSILNSVAQARENLRSCREIIPAQLWTVINDLQLFVQAHVAEGINRTSRGRFLSRIILDVQLCWGIVEDSMRRDEANALLALGRNVERADMTTRVLDVRAVGILVDADRYRHADLQWAAVLRSVSALQMYQRTVRNPVTGSEVVQFLLGDDSFPRSVRHCLAQLERITATLPRSAQPMQACAHARAILSSRWLDLCSEEPVALRSGLDAVQMGIGQVSDSLVRTYVHPDAPH